MITLQFHHFCWNFANVLRKNSLKTEKNINICRMRYRILRNFTDFRNRKIFSLFLTFYCFLFNSLLRATGLTPVAFSPRPCGSRCRMTGSRTSSRSCRRASGPWLKGSISNLSLIFQPNDQTLWGSFSSVSTPNVASKYSLESS